MRAAVDMDGTIADFTTASFNRVEELYGIKMTRADAYKPKTAQLVWERMTDEQRSKYGDHRELYGEICDSGFFLNLKPFPGAVEAVKQLYNTGVEIIFLTKVLNWERSAPEKALWLKKYFGDIKYLTLMTDSVHGKRIADVDVFIDDDLRVMETIKDTPKILIKQPWNQRGWDTHYPVAEDFVQAAELALLLKNEKSQWNKYWREQDETQTSRS
jgi:5'(3')-deoxyribonucleotidase